MATILRRSQSRAPEARYVEPIGKHNNAVESLRGVAALAVVGYHLAAVIAWPKRFPPRLLLSNGDAGVTLFFVLSGFLLWRPFAKATLDGERTPSIRQFMTNRVLRIVPAYWAALTAVLVLIDHRAPGGAWRYYLFAQNFSHKSFFGVISPAWSLAVEAIFYLALPIAGIAALRLARRTRSDAGRAGALYAVIGAWFVASFLYKLIVFSHHSPSDVIVAFNFPAKAHLFAFGMLLATWHARDRSRAPFLSGRPWAGPVLGAGLLIAAVGLRYHSALTQIWFDTACAIGFTLIVYGVIFEGTRRTALHRALDWRPLVWAGTMSYSIYLLHHPLISWMAKHHLLRSPMSWLILDAAIVLAAVLAVAWLSYRTIEQPFLNLRKRWS